MSTPEQRVASWSRIVTLAALEAAERENAEDAEAVRDRLEHALNIMQMHEIDNRRLRDGIAALASSYAQYQTDVWGADVAANLRALLDTQ
jgi:hypothetical protein